MRNGEYFVKEPRKNLFPRIILPGIQLLLFGTWVKTLTKGWRYQGIIFFIGQFDLRSGGNGTLRNWKNFHDTIYYLLKEHREEQETIFKAFSGLQALMNATPALKVAKRPVESYETLVALESNGAALWKRYNDVLNQVKALRLLGVPYRLDGLFQGSLRHKNIPYPGFLSIRILIKELAGQKRFRKFPQGFSGANFGLENLGEFDSGEV